MINLSQIQNLLMIIEIILFEIHTLRHCIMKMFPSINLIFKIDIILHYCVVCHKAYNN